MKSRIITIVSGLLVLGLGIFAVVQMNNTQKNLAMIAVVVSLVPMYFLYSALVLGKYAQREDKHMFPEQRLEKMLKEKKTLPQKKSSLQKKSAKGMQDKGKVLEFPNEKHKNNRKNK